ncbi:hypothetical protein ACONUD_17895 [Microbulbifer harenosus]|uniref:Uncharacterized protein n=1 Tax=Microbulbifer harenosus TaxID=2576840 RepID=A0ABY2UJH6_9GAMM|nr:hypothetical protein [Microbulbifer harenosus]TLM78187.1 hypothetical protein FDY93_07110 [Microbulbifer harenosus]
MIMSKGAMTLAEGSQKDKFKTDATLVLNGSQAREYVLRTAYDQLSVWKAKYAVSVSPFYPRLRTSIKEAALIDNEIWVFGVDGTNSSHIIDAVKVATQFYQVNPRDILSNIYIKNMNAEGQHEGNMPLLVRLNMGLYENTTKAIADACRHFGIHSGIKIHVYSSNINPKIPKPELHQALKSGGAKAVETDSRKIRHKVGSNNGEDSVPLVSNLHVAILEF